MNGYEFYKGQNEEVGERLELALERIAQIPRETEVKPPYQEYFTRMAAFISRIGETAGQLRDGSYYKLSLNELEHSNTALYEDIVGAAYETSYTNPAYSCLILGREYGQALCVLAAELRRTIDYIFAGCMSMTANVLEAFIEIYNLFEGGEPAVKEIKSIIYYFKKDYCGEELEFNIRRNFEPDRSSGLDIVEGAGLDSPEYLYHFGNYVSENERKISTFLSSMRQEEIEAMARTYTNGYKKGFLAYRIDLSKKSVVSVRCHLGFERMIRAALMQFHEMGLGAAILISSTDPNRQYSFDHRFDRALYLDRHYVDCCGSEQKRVYENHKEKAAALAGPAVQMVFGETPFEPLKKPEALSYDKKQQELDVKDKMQYSMTVQEYIKSEETSFTIIAYPVPEIGPDFEKIFAETVKVNTLDSDLYKNIQQRLIDVLDEGVYVHILGAAPNRTDIKVSLHPLDNPAAQTNFENCIDDVNIPVGEVFTSPLLAGTNGILHVTDVYLRDLRFLNLALTFQDGMISSYDCTNFKNQEDNKNFLKENLLQNHDSLPMGEFAIGTNTTAYTMARKYCIQDKLPILIAEKTGPHFAVGDTCYHMSEDRAVYNPDGKEIIARDNEYSLTRKTDMSKAYFNCHTDITIPYNELKEISVYRADGSKETLIRDGRFILPGTEELNKALA